MTNIELATILLEDVKQVGIREVGCTFGADQEDEDFEVDSAVRAQEKFWIVIR